MLVHNALVQVFYKRNCMSRSPSCCQLEISPAPVSLGLFLSWSGAVFQQQTSQLLHAELRLLRLQT